MNRTTLTRIVLATIGCLPLLYYYVWLSIALFLGVLFLGIYLGFWIVAGALLWWILGTAGFAVLFYSSVTFTPARQGLPVWQIVGLTCGLIAVLPFGIQCASNRDWNGLLAVLLACFSAAYVMVSAYGGNRKGAQQ